MGRTLTRRCTTLLTTAIAVIALAVTGALSPPAAHAAARTSHTAATRQVLVSPIDPSGKLRSSYRITHTAKNGDCSSGSNYLPGADRCFVGNLIYDPCWNATAKKHSGAFCPSRPWSRHGTFVRTFSTAYPEQRGQGLWGVQTGDGHRCVLLSGSLDSYRDKPVDFACGKSHRYLLGQPSRKHARWTIDEVRADKNFHYSHLHRVSITRAWLGVSAAGAITSYCPADQRFVKIWNRRYPHHAKRADVIRCSHGWATGGIIPPGAHPDEFTATFKRIKTGWRAVPRDVACRPNGIPKKPHYFWLLACQTN